MLASKAGLCCFWPSTIGSVLCAFFLNSQCDFDFVQARRAGAAIALIAFLGLAPVLGFAYTSWRFPRADSNDLAQFAGRHVYLEATVESVLPLKSSGQGRFICAAQSVHVTRRQFGSRNTDSQCEGQTLLLLRQGTPFIDKLNRKTHFKCACTVTSVEELAKRGKSGYATYLKRIGINSLCYFDGRQNAIVLAESRSGWSLVLRPKQ